MRPLVNRLTTGSMIGIAAFGLLNYLLLLLGFEFWAASLPLALALGFALASAPKLNPSAEHQACPPWVKLICLLLLGAVLIALAYGSGITPSRHWDGAVAWELKAWYLTLEPSLEQDFFRAEEVFHHSRDYPLLQPLCLAAGNRLLGEGMGRFLFPCLYLLLLAFLGIACRQRCQQGYLPWLGMLALGLTPMLTNPVMGGADSGFADLFLAVGVMGLATGVLLRDLPLLAAATVVTVFVKPEGTAYALLPLVLFWCREDRSAMYVSLAACCLGLAVWLPLQHDLQQLGRAESIAIPIVFGLMAFALVLVLGDLLMHRLAMSPRGRWLCLASLGITALLCAPVLVGALGNESGTLGIYLSDLSRPLERLPRIPLVLYGLIERGLLHGRFALAYTLLAVMSLGILLRKRRFSSPELATLMLLGIMSICMPFFFSPEADLEHHLRASMDRLLLHWLGPAFLLSIVCIDAEIRQAGQTGDRAPSK